MLRLPLDRNLNGVVIYDGIDDDNESSAEAASRFMAWLDHLKTQPDSADEDSQCSEESREDEAVTLLMQLQFTLDALLTTFPAYGFTIKAAAYQAGIFEPDHTHAYDPGFNRFFRHTDTIPVAQLPDEIAAFIHVLRVYSEKSCEQSSQSFNP